MLDRKHPQPKKPVKAMHPSQLPFDIITKQQLKQLNTEYESTKSGVYFLFVIVSLIACLLCLLTVLVVTSIVYLAGEEEMQILFEMKDIDSRMFRLELT